MLFVIAIIGLLVIFTYTSSIYLLAIFHLKTDLSLSYLSGIMLNDYHLSYHLTEHYQKLHDFKSNIIPNLSPPFSLMLTAIAAKCISYTNFFIVFMAFEVCVNIWALISLYQYFYPKKNTDNQLILCLFVFANLIYLPTFANITFGQVALLLNALIIFTFLALKKNKPILAGILLALALNIKLFFGVFAIYLIAQKRYRALFSFIIVSLIFALIPLFIYGTSIYEGYFFSLSNISWYAVNWNASFYGFFSRLLGDSHHIFNTPFSFADVAKLIYDMFFWLYLFLIYWFSRKNKNTESLAFSFTLSAMLLISPLGWIYYFPLLLTALLINLKSFETNRYYPLFFTLILLALFLSALPFPIIRDYKSSAIILVSKGNIFFLSLLLFNITTIFQILFSAKENKNQLLSKKLKLFILFLCFFPSIIYFINLSLGNYHYENLTLPKASEDFLIL